jgi:hypothetical protein
MKLELNSRVGDFVHQNQNMAKDEGFKCVSRIWFNKTQPISAGIDAITNDARNRFDVSFPKEKFNVNVGKNGQPVLTIDGNEYTPTAHAWKHLCYWFYVPQTYYNMALAPISRGKQMFKRDLQDVETFVRVFQNEHRRIDGEKDFTFRVDNTGNLRAMFSDRYAIINNVWYLETLQEVFREIGGDEPRLSHWRGDADTIYGNVLIPDTCREEKDSDYGGMISVSNCEIGKRRLDQTPSIFRAICMNGCIWDQNVGEKISKVHRGEIDLVALRERIILNIHKQIPLAKEGIDRLLKTRDKVIPTDVPMVNLFANLHKAFKLETAQTLAVSEEYSKHEAGDRNLFGIINAFTRAGQRFDPETWVAFDEIGGTLLNSVNAKGVKSWDYMVDSAKALTKEDISEIFKAAV